MSEGKGEKKVGPVRSFKHTRYACFLGYITQAIVNNFAPLLFLTFHKTYGISLEEIALLITINFGVQLLVDFLSIRFVDRIGYRASVVIAHVFAVAGLVGLSVFPDRFSSPYAGLILAIALYAIGGGIIEVLISPIIEACPSDEKAGAMSLLHSFYCWGHVLVVVLSTLYFSIAGIGYWKVLACIWALIPMFNIFYFMKVPIASLVDADKGMSVGQLFSKKLFWILIMLMVCSGAAEQAMSQWASAFAELGLKVSKSVGDLTGPSLFAFLMGTSRAFYAKFSDRIKLDAFMFGSGILCVIGYLLASLSPLPAVSLLGCGLCGLSAGIFWPGSISLSAKGFPAGGTAMFAFLALAGDVGCSLGPGIVGFVSGALGDRLKMGLLSAIVFPLLFIAGINRYTRSAGNAAVHDESRSGHMA